MARRTVRKTEANRAAIYSRVSDKSQAAEDRTSLSEQVAEMERYCEERGMAIAARYQEVGRGWSKKRPEFQRMLEDARNGLFDTIVCWKSDRLSRGVYPAAALMEVVEAYGIELESVMDAIDMKTFGLMAAIGKIELDGIRERTSMGRRGAAKRGRVPSGKLPYGYRVGEGGRPEIVEEQAQVVRRIFQMYLKEGMGTELIARRLTEEGVPPARSTKRWHHTHVSRILSNEAYKGVWNYGRRLTRSTEDGIKIFYQPRESWIEVAVPPLVDEEAWGRAQRQKKERRSKSPAQHKDFLPPAAHDAMRRVRDALWGPLLLDHIEHPQREEVPLRPVHSPPVLLLLRNAAAPGLQGAPLHQGGAAGWAGLERGEGRPAKPRTDPRRHRLNEITGIRWRGRGDCIPRARAEEGSAAGGTRHRSLRDGQDHREPVRTPACVDRRTAGGPEDEAGRLPRKAGERSGQEGGDGIHPQVGGGDRRWRGRHGPRAAKECLAWGRRGDHHRPAQRGEHHARRARRRFIVS